MLPNDGRIGYVLTERRWAVYSDDDLDKTCPNGFNGGPRDGNGGVGPIREAGAGYANPRRALCARHGAWLKSAALGPAWNSSGSVPDGRGAYR